MLCYFITTCLVYFKVLACCTLDAVFRYWGSKHEYYSLYDIGPNKFVFKFAEL